MIYRAYCRTCNCEVNVESRRYFGYLLGGSAGCFKVIVHALGLFILNVLWAGVLIGCYFAYGTHYFCVSCGREVHKGDLQVR